MGYGLGNKREDFLSDLTACHGTAPVMSSGAIESPKQPRVEANPRTGLIIQTIY
jgi:hypothetical protein